MSVLEPLEKYQNDQPFELWLNDFDDFVLANFGTVSNDRKRAILMQLCGDDVKKFVDSLEPQDKTDYKKLLEILKQKFNHLENEIVERHIFNTMVQDEDELIDAFVLRLRTQAKKCNYRKPSTTTTVTIAETDHQVAIQFEDISDNLIRDRIVVGITNQNIKTRLLREKSLNLDTAIAIVKAQELADERINTLQESTTYVNAINGQKRKRPLNKPNISVKPYTKPQISSSSVPKRFRTRSAEDCGYCGRNHDKSANCPAYGQICNSCNKRNHFSKVCRQRNINTLSEEQDCLTEDNHPYYTDQEETLSHLSIGMLSARDRNQKNWVEYILFGKVILPCKIDTGAECDVISIENLYKINDNARISSTNTVVKAFGERKLPISGTTALPCILNSVELNTKFFVVPFKAQTVIGLQTSIKLGLISGEVLQRKYYECALCSCDK